MEKSFKICVVSLLLVAFSSADVRLPPNILTHPVDNIFKSDATITLECEAEGVPKVTYTWELNGQELNLNKPTITKLADVGTIVISPAYRIDEGVYQCFAQNQYGKALSREAHVSYAILDVEHSEVKDYPVSVGESLKVRCDGVTSNPPPIYTWQIAESTVDTSPITVITDQRVQIDLDGTLHFANIVANDAQAGKVYKCNARNSYTDKSAGGSYSKIDVTGGSPMSHRPELTYSTGPAMIGLKGEEVKLKCLYKGFSTPTVAWSLEGGQLPPSRNFIEEHGTELRLTDLRYEDEGNYQCTGSNSVDRVATIIQLQIQSVPTFQLKNPSDPNSEELKPSNLNKTEREAASFLCKPEGVPLPTIQWLINGDEIDNASPGARRSVSEDGYNLTVIDLCKDCANGKSDLMVVQCVATNAHGSAYAQGYLNVLEETILTVTPKNANMADWDVKVTFNCSATTDPSTELVYRWLHQGYEVDTSRPGYTIEGTNLIVEPVKEEDKERQEKMGGEYECDVSNGYTKKTAKAYLTLPVTAPPVIATGGFNILDYWWVFLIIVIILLIILLCICCYCCYQRNKGDEYLVDEKDRQNGFDPEKELADSGFHDFQRPESTPFKGSRASLTSTIKLDTDDETSLLEYGEPDTGKFNEDGSFIGQYHDRSKRYNDSTV